MEGERKEYKKSLATMEELLESIVAFANAAGGEIYIGIEDDGKVVGVTVGKNTMENLANEITRTIEPKVDFSLKTTKINGAEIIIITIPSSNIKPHFFKSIAYKRIGRSNMKLSPQQLGELFVKRALSLHDVDSLQLNIGLEDISEELLKDYVDEISKKYSDKDGTLRTLGLKDNGFIRPSAILFFGIQPEKFFPLYGVKCAVFKGSEMLSIRDFQQPIYAAVAQAITFIKQNIPSVIRFEGIKRYEENIIPESALREALLNALVHADYTLDATIYIKITEKVIEIRNGGTLPAPLTIEELEKPHISKPRNRRIAGLCHAIGWIEHWGEGTLKIAREMRKRGLDIEFEEKNGYFSIRLHLKEMKLNKRRERIFQIIKRKKKITTKDLKNLKIPARTIRADLVFLAKKGFVKKTGKGREISYIF